MLLLRWENSSFARNLHSRGGRTPHGKTQKGQQTLSTAQLAASVLVLAQNAATVPFLCLELLSRRPEKHSEGLNPGRLSPKLVCTQRLSCCHTRPLLSAVISTAASCCSFDELCGFRRLKESRNRHLSACTDLRGTALCAHRLTSTLAQSTQHSVRIGPRATWVHSGLEIANKSGVYGYLTSLLHLPCLRIRTRATRDHQHALRIQRILWEAGMLTTTLRVRFFRIAMEHWAENARRGAIGGLVYDPRVRDPH